MKRIIVTLCILSLLASLTAIAAVPKLPSQGNPVLVIGPGFMMDTTGQMRTQGGIIDIGLRVIPGSNPRRYEVYDKATGSNDIYKFTIRYMQPGDRFILTFRYKLEPVTGLDLSVPAAVWFQCRQIEDRESLSFPVYIPLNRGEWDGNAPGPRDDKGSSYTLGDFPPNLANKIQFQAYTKVFRAGQTEVDAIRVAGRVPDTILNDTSDTLLLSSLNAATLQRSDWLSVWDSRDLFTVSLSEGDVVYLYYYGRWDGNGFVAPGTKGAELAGGGSGLAREDNDYMSARARLQWLMGLGAEELVVTPTKPPVVTPTATPPTPTAPPSGTPGPVETVEPSGPPMEPLPSDRPEQTFSPTPFPEETINPSQPPGTKPKTGDDYNLALWIALCIVSVIALISLFVFRKRRKDRKGY